MEITKDKIDTLKHHQQNMVMLLEMLKQKQNNYYPEPCNIFEFEIKSKHIQKLQNKVIKEIQDIEKFLKQILGEDYNPFKKEKTKPFLNFSKNICKNNLQIKNK